MQENAPLFFLTKPNKRVVFATSNPMSACGLLVIAFMQGTLLRQLLPGSKVSTELDANPVEMNIFYPIKSKADEALNEAITVSEDGACTLNASEDVLYNLSIDQDGKVKVRTSATPEMVAATGSWLNEVGQNFADTTASILAAFNEQMEMVPPPAVFMWLTTSAGEVVQTRSLTPDAIQALGNVREEIVAALPKPFGLASADDLERAGMPVNGAVDLGTIPPERMGHA